MSAARIVSLSVGALAIAEVLRRAVLGWKRRKFCGLDSLVSFSACVIAARRAFETELSDAYIRDPLAEGLCGKEALEVCRKRVAAAELKQRNDSTTSTSTADSTSSAGADTSSSSLPTPPTAGAADGIKAPSPAQAPAPNSSAAVGPARPISRLIIRTKFFDDVAAIVTWHGAAAAAAVPCHAQLAAVCRAAAQCKQVVLLGSGLDSRPWRLALPPGVAWFEVDRRDVLAAKTRRLNEMGAQTQTQTPRARAAKRQLQAQGAEPLQMRSLSGTAAGGATPTRQEEQARPALPDEKVEEYAHPLKAASWACVAVDLQHRGWSRGLLRAGLDPAASVCWILEGLLYYLEERDVRALLQEAASVSGPGSVLAASIIQAPPAAEPGSGSASSAATPTATAAAAAAAAATPSAAGSSPLTPTAPGTPSAPAAGVAADSASSVGTPPTGGTKAGGKAGAKASGSGGWNVRSEFKWRCEGGVGKFLGECGWSALWTESWLQTVASYGLTPEGGSTASGVYFTSAKLG
ncbi:hypothetical protein HYH02_002073 [Chlamydomonas schloesseri]|uniref:S-adenosyl-L-methionine-dependent methyltransferase n=1 Tax=Chlamydomonas schloesseri TaxID=2026947 RepID=A0A835WUG7_9CHLO|nr:hypothetical protein HYH02_002073 [Chlamydomonas schloesseri]|eukprot:KAG2453866.1 hypothetical protein HYH02_002073 [Chlamydomonas schloesseri]